MNIVRVNDDSAVACLLHVTLGRRVLVKLIRIAGSNLLLLNFIYSVVSRVLADRSSPSL